MMEVHLEGAQFEMLPCSKEANEIVESVGSAGTTSGQSGAPHSTFRQASGSIAAAAASYDGSAVNFRHPDTVVPTNVVPQSNSWLWDPRLDDVRARLTKLMKEMRALDDESDEMSSWWASLVNK